LQLLAEKQKLRYYGRMRQSARGQNFETKVLPSESIRAVRPGTGALMIFLPAQASQATENIDSGRENPRKSKQNERSSKALFATKARLADDIQMSSAVPELAGIGAGANFSLPAPSKLLKTNDRRRFAAENGGKRRRSSAGIRAFVRATQPAYAPEAA
jgi:hypothetical protein